jgi:hypothetical protein
MKTKAVSTLALMTILLMSALITPNLTSGQMTSTSQQNANTHPNEKASFTSSERLAISMILKYLSIFGYKSPAIVQFNTTEHEAGLDGAGMFNVLDNGRITTVQVTSNFLFEKNSPDYEYNARFTLRNGTAYSVEECSSERIDGSQLEASFTQKISGSFNFFLSAVQETALAKQMTKTTNINMEYSNSTGTYYARCQSNALLSSDGTEVISSSLTIDQNIFSQRGRYSYSFSPKTDGLGTKCLMTMPNGAVVDPSSTLYISANGDYSTHLDVYLIGFTAAEQAGEGFLEAIAGAILEVITHSESLAFLAAVLAPLGGLLLALGLFTASAYFLYPSSMDGIIMLYIKYVSLMWTGPFLWETHRFPLYLELGFYTDQFMFQDLGDWYYYPVFNSITGNSYPQYTCDWPPTPDPYVTFHCYDESTSTNVDGIPIYLNGTLTGTTGSTIFMIPGTYIVQVDDYGDNFHYFDVDGDSVYNNPATITVGESDMPITVYYYSLPTSEVGVIAIEATTQEFVPTNVYIDSQYVGESFSYFDVQVGVHAIEGDAYVYVPNLGSYVGNWYVEIDEEFYDYGCLAEINLSTEPIYILFVYIWQ